MTSKLGGGGGGGGAKEIVMVFGYQKRKGSTLGDGGSSPRV